MVPTAEYNQEIYDFIRGDQHSWKEIYAWGYDDQEKVLPAEPGPARNYFTDKARLRKAIDLYLPKVQQKLAALTDTILSKQDQEKQRLLKTAEEIATGRFDDIVNVGTPDTIEELRQRLEEGRREIASPEYRKRIMTATVVSVDLEEIGQYVGLVRIARGLHQFLKEGRYDPAAMGRVPALYHSLSQ